MWYFTWILGVSFAASFAILNAMWFEAHAQRIIQDGFPGKSDGPGMTRIVRAASFITALTTSLALLLFPFVLREVPAERLHSALPILLLGISTAFIYGVGFKPDNRFLSVVFGPIVTWMMIAGGAMLIWL